MARFGFAQISKRFGVVQAVSFDVADGEFFVLLGSIGAGRPPCCGCLRVWSRPMPAGSRSAGGT